MAEIKLRQICKSYKGDNILDELNLTIPGGIFFALLGPSGCGKTTILRLIAGLEAVDAGTIYLGNLDITRVPVYQRKINTVFQKYALFPHLDVYENIAYGLRIRGLKEAVIKERVEKYLSIVRLQGKESRFPDALSGGQQQRVALARALAVEPEVVLFDEPLSALDQKLKEQMIVEFSDLQYTLKTTFLYVTHDQNEALTLADEMAIMNADGQIEQIGTPKQVYEFPKSRFVADFIGSTTILEGTLRRVEEHIYAVEVQEVGEIKVYVPTEKNWMIPGKIVFASIRPEKIIITRAENQEFANSLKGAVKNIIYYGGYTKYRIELANSQTISVLKQNRHHFPKESIEEDEVVFLNFEKENVVLLEN
jgi:ABC-type Fe3+/spermidine/putrescine transport system ATPase subunit